MAKLRLPTVLRPLADGAAILEIPAGSLGTLRETIRTSHPALGERVYEPDGSVREFISVFVDGEDSRELGDDHPVADRSEIVLLPAISGGSDACPEGLLTSENWAMGASRLNPIAIVGNNGQEARR